MYQVNMLKETIEYFNKQGIHTTLITGDSEMTGKAVASKLGIDEVIANVMPDEKSKIIDKQKEKIWCDRNGRRWCK